MATIPHEGYRALPDQLRELATQGEQAPADAEKLQAYASQVEVLISDLEQSIECANKESKARAKQRKTLSMIEHLVDLSKE